jgi:hypothetical protein
MTTDERIAIAVQEGRLRTRAARGGGDEAAIERAYRQLAMDMHPDKGGDPAKFRALTAARDNLIARLASIEVAFRKVPGLEPLTTETKN